MREPKTIYIMKQRETSLSIAHLHTLCREGNCLTVKQIQPIKKILGRDQNEEKEKEMVR